MAATEQLRTARLDPGHAEAGAHLSAEAGWNQTADDWRLMLQTGEAIGQLTADGELVASALILPYGGRGGSKVAWIAMVLTTGRWRRCGLATANLRWAIDRCRARGLIAGLDATPEGRLVYRPLGFRDAFGLCRFRCAAPAPAPVEASGITVRPMRSDDLAAATRLDAEAFGARRRQLIAYLRANQPDRAFVAKADGQLTGMVLARAGRVALHLGPLYAHSPEIATALTARALTGVQRPVSLDVPDAQSRLVEWLSQGGFRPVRPFIRMMQSAHPQLGRPELAFAIAGPEFG
jgi:GNAT superfamily N-acetyltransferase